MGFIVGSGGGRGLISAIALATAAAMLVAAAVVSDGYRSTDAELYDGAVWVTKGADSVGRFNLPARGFDARVPVSGGTVEVLQDAGVVVAQAGGQSWLVPVAAPELKHLVGLPADAAVSLAGGTAAVTERASGKLWVVPEDQLATVDAAVSTPTAVLGEGAAVVVGSDGVTHAVSVTNDALYEVEPPPAGGDETAAAPAAVSFGRDLTAVQVSAVGGTAVVLDEASGTLFAGTTQIAELGDAGKLAQLQQAGPATARVGEQTLTAPGVLVATPASLLSVPLGGGDPRTLAEVDPGSPDAPAWVAGCATAAWSSAPAGGSYAYACGEEQATVSAVADASGVADVSQEPTLRLRTNRDAAVLNDVVTGAVYYGRDLAKADQWPETDDERRQRLEEEAATQTEQPKESVPNRPPKAQPDQFGARAGVPVVLPILRNDSDPDGDILAVESIDVGAADAATLAVSSVADGGSVQVTARADASGVQQFDYTVSDGRGLSASATVSVTIVPPETNRPPQWYGELRPTVGSGESVTFDVMPYWEDPDGDPLVLTAASATGGGQVRFAPDGKVTFTADLGFTGTAGVETTVADDRGQTATRRIDVLVVTLDSEPPVARDDLFTALAGHSVMLDPLRNDNDPLGQSLRLMGVEESPKGATGATAVIDTRSGTIGFTAPAPGSYYLLYRLAAGSRQAEGFIRVDVHAAGGNSAPVAVRDVAVLPSGGGSVLVDVLANDFDPDGDVLVVTSVRSHSGDSLTAAVVDHRFLRLAQGRQPLLRSATLEYSISDGTQAQVTGTVVVTVPPAGAGNSPVARNDSASVRAGDVVAVPVLDNDTDADGDPLTLVSVEPLPAELGLVLISGEFVRYQAPISRPSVPVLLRYTIRTPDQRTATADVSVSITPVEQGNSAPTPASLEARATIGQKIRIPVPLVGVDPDGDSVRLTGIVQQGTLGIAGLDPATGDLVYESISTVGGTDTFTYEVADTFGAVGRADVRVGVTAASAENQNPVAVDDVVIARPGRTLLIGVLANDSDPEDGSDISFVAQDPISVPEGLRAEVRGRSIQVELPDGEDSYVIGYRIRDTTTGTASGSLKIQASHSAAAIAPVANDDVVPLSAVGPGSTEVSVAVLANDYDPDGSNDDLVVSVPDGSPARASADQVVVTLTDQAQVLPYRVTDPDGESSTAFVRVPPVGSANLPPRLKPDVAAPRASAGEPLRLTITDYIEDPEGGQLLVVANPSAIGGSVQWPEPLVVEFTAQDLVNRAAVTVLVADDGDPRAQALLSIAVNVAAATNTPPAFTSQTVEVGTQDGEVQFDLRPAVIDPDAADSMTFADAQFPAGLRGELSQDGQLRLSATADPGSEGTVEFTVQDGHNPPVAGMVRVLVVSSSRELARTVPIILEARAGTTVHADVLRRAMNPFEEPLSLKSAVVTQGQGQAEVSGSEVSFTAPQGFFGTAVVTYIVADQTDDRARDVQGTVTINVKDVPAAPDGLRAAGEQARTVDLQWEAADPRGAPVTRYTVIVDGSRKVECGTATRCLVEGLQNGTPYSFAVTAENEKGTSSASTPITAIPDAVPDIMAPVIVDFVKTGGAITVAWQPSKGDWSTVTGYDLRLSGGGSQTAAGDQTSLTWTGLTNGTSYEVAICPKNQKRQLCDDENFSSWSAPVVPAAPPGPPASISAARADDPNGGSVNVAWEPGASNGDTVNKWDIAVLENGTRVADHTVAGDTHLSLSGLNTSGRYTFEVMGTNKAGTGGPGTSGVVIPFGKPAAVGAVKVSPSDSSAKASFAGVSGNGIDVQYYEASIDSGASMHGRVKADGTVGGLKNGQTYTLRIRACHEICGDWSPESNAVTPYGPPLSPEVAAVTADSGNIIRFSWKVPPANGRQVIKLEVFIDDELVTQDPQSGAVEHKYPVDGKPHSIYAVAYDSDGRSTTSATASATTFVPSPQPSGSQQTYRAADTFGGGPGAAPLGTKIPAGTSVAVTCRASNQGAAPGNHGGWWYKVASPPWTNYWVPASLFRNGDPPTGPFVTFVDTSVPVCN